MAYVLAESSCLERIDLTTSPSGNLCHCRTYVDSCTESRRKWSCAMFTKSSNVHVQTALVASLVTVLLGSPAFGGVSPFRTHYGSDGSLMGMSATALGDINGDSVPDYAIGMVGAAGFRGAVAVISGA